MNPEDNLNEPIKQVREPVSTKASVDMDMD